MRRLCGLALVFCASACTAITAVDDGTSLSYGWSHRGELLNAAHLPARGDGYVVPPAWAGRGNSYATEELVGLVVRSARAMAEEEAGSLLYVADMSPPHGGPSQWHRSHQTGRDADLIYFALDEKGRRAPPPSGMIKFDDHGATAPIEGVGRLYFDTARNWRLVRTLLEDPGADVQFLFIARPLRELLLGYATAMAEPQEIIERAQAVLQQPSDAAAHDDHLHVRIYCPASDRVLGCHDRGPLRWFKKSWKYLAAHGALDVTLDPIVTRPFCRFLGRNVLATL